MANSQPSIGLDGGSSRICVPEALSFDSNFAPLLEFAKESQVPAGFGYLNADGTVAANRPAELWITSRMTHVFSLASMLDYPGAKEKAEHGVRALRRYFKDSDYGGWFSAVDANGGEVVDESKQAYAHAFVLLAATSALAAGVSGAQELFDDALANQDEHWFDPQVGRVRESWDRAFTTTEDYRGINANMHTVEAYLAAADLTGNEKLLNRAVGILDFVAGQAQKNEWRIPEHYTSDWTVQPAYNKDDPAHPFRPFGATPGHGFEWARLMLQARQSVMNFGRSPGEWMLPAAVELYLRASADSWNVDGAPGFIYTTDFDGKAVVTQRMHWVLAEAVGAAVVLYRVLQEEHFADAEGLKRKLRAQINEWGEYAADHLREAPGRWHHELDAANSPDSGTWPGKPDAYHLAQMFLLPLLPVSPAFAVALGNGLFEL